MSRKSTGWLLALVLTVIGGSAQALDFAFGFSPRTGDAWMDARLGDMNVFAHGHSDGFIDDVVISFGAPRYLVRDLYFQRRWAPGDIYYACALAYQLRRPCLEVVRVYERDHGQGWGAIARRMGIKPGSAQFHALKGYVGKSNGKFRGYGKGPKHDDRGGRHDVGGDYGRGNDHGSGKGNNKHQDKGHGRGG